MLNNDEEVFSEVANMLNCHQDAFPITQLGFPFRAKKLKKEDWQPMIDKVDRRLAS